VNCFRASRMVSAYIDGELPGVESLQMSDHLRTCCRCSQEYDSLLALKRRLGALAACEPGKGFDEIILQRIHEAGAVSSVTDLRLPWRHRFTPMRHSSLQLIAVAALGCVSAVVVMYGRPGARLSPSLSTTPPPPVTAAVSHNAVAVNDLIFVHDESAAMPPRANGLMLDTEAMKVVDGGPRIVLFSDRPGR
jgi:anti-sigma factor RsiW